MLQVPALRKAFGYAALSERAHATENAQVCRLADRTPTEVFREVEEIASMIKLNYPYILAYKPDARTPIIERRRIAEIRVAVVGIAEGESPRNLRVHRHAWSNIEQAPSRAEWGTLFRIIGRTVAQIYVLGSRAIVSSEAV